MAPPGQHGRTIGIILSGVLLGILLARTVSGTVASFFGWRVMYWIASLLALVFAALLRVQLPLVPPKSRISYRELIFSIFRLVLEQPKLRRISFLAAMFFASFIAFWTTLVFLLETPPYHYGSQTAGLFGLIGATGILVAPMAGRQADRRSPRFVVGIALLIVLAAFVLFWWFGFQLWGLVLGVILLDAGVQAAQVANQSSVLALLPEARNRVNTVYMICYFTGGSLGSLLGSWSWGRWQWHGVCACGIGFMLLAAVIFLTQPTEPPARTAAAAEL